MTCECKWLLNTNQLTIKWVQNFDFKKQGAAQTGTPNGGLIVVIPQSVHFVSYP